ncbi:putative esterase [Fibrisoma limi BUZ 3]|uniref:Putative esterase n=1 Tax=Fibrisoma limi BUZ 3 TaxID=1185876 RepID=I2GSF8_9BACT|nr:esterase [Fibrisoma limi]CCH56837.1 putative esterase [Fibrisoma limi BUZ 3]
MLVKHRVRYVNALLMTTLLVGGKLMAQAPQRQPNPNDTLRSPQVLADNRVALRIYAPKASEVTVAGDFLGGGKPLNLTKNEQGVWSVVTGPLKPDYYSYTLTVDGVRTMDPKNPVIKQGISSLENMMAVTGKETAFEEIQPVPHGEVRQAWYQSKSLATPRRMHIYTPPGYEQGKTKYPVFYLLHGGGDDDSGWNTIGRAGFILDNLIAAGKAKPMIVVMPNGSMPMPPSSTMADFAQRLPQMQEMFANELLNDVMPYVEKNYRTLAGRDKRALAGLSMGGIQTLNVALLHPELFSYVGVFSSGFFGGTANEAGTRYAKTLQDPAFNKNNKLFLFQIGKDDFLLESCKQTMALFDQHKIKYQYKETDGGHTWINWRQYLSEYAPLLFQ